MNNDQNSEENTFKEVAHGSISYTIKMKEDGQYHLDIEKDDNASVPLFVIAAMMKNIYSDFIQKEVTNKYVHYAKTRKPYKGNVSNTQMRKWANVVEACQEIINETSKYLRKKYEKIVFLEKANQAGIVMPESHNLSLNENEVDVPREDNIQAEDQRNDNH